MDTSKKIVEIENKYLNLFCEGAIGSPLVPSDSHEEPEDKSLPCAMMTHDKTFYFVPDYNNPVMRESRGLGKSDQEKTPVPGKYHYSIEIIKCYPGNSMNPEEYDLFAIEDNIPSLEKAISSAAHHLLDWKLNSIGEGLFFQKENELFPIIEKYMSQNY